MIRIGVRVVNLFCCQSNQELFPSSDVGSMLFRQVIALKVVNNTQTYLKLLCAAAERLFQAGADDNRHL